MMDQRAGQIGLVIVTYVHSVFAMAVLGMVVPLMSAVSLRLHVPADTIGMSLAYFSAPAALMAALFGFSVDRMGPRAGFLLSAALVTAGDLFLMQAGTLWQFRAGLALSGCGFAYATVACPALFLRYLPAARQGGALAFWSTFSPAGYASGLLLSIPFLGHPDWRGACLCHLALIITILIAAAPVLLNLHDNEHLESRAQLPDGRLRVLGPAAALLGVAIALPNGVSYGTALIAPSYLARMYHVSMAASATDVAVIKIIVMLLSGLVVGSLVSSAGKARRIFVAMAVAGLAAQLAFLFPGSGFLLASVALFAWMFAFGSISGAGMALMATIAQNGKNRAALAGLVGQLISIMSFLVPAIYFSTTAWTSYLAFAAIGLFAAGIAIRFVAVKPAAVDALAKLAGEPARH